jgi:hypothetical protein
VPAKEPAYDPTSTGTQKKKKVVARCIDLAKVLFDEEQSAEPRQVGPSMTIEEWLASRE